MKVIFITAPYNIVKSGYGTKAKANYGLWPPIGLGFLASAVRDAGHTPEIIDSPALNYNNQDLIKHLKKSKPDVIGVQSLYASKDETLKLIEELKANFPVPIFLGGAFATSFPESILKENSCIDFVFVGEAERTIVEVLDNLTANKPLVNINGLCCRDNSKVIKTPPREIVKNLDEISAPAWDLFDFKLYQPLPLNHKKWPCAPYLTSRGCSYARCTFCFESGSAAPKYRRHSPQRVISDIKNLVDNYGIQEISFWDDILMVNQDWVLEFCSLMKKEGLDKIPWQCYGYAGSTTKPMLEAVKSAGCWNIFYGLETGNQDVLDKIKKGVTIERMKEVLKWTHDLGIDTRGSFVLALPGETPEKAMNTVQFAIDNNLTFVQFLPLFPEYGTEVYNEFIKKGGGIDKYKGRTTAQYVPQGYKDSEEVEKTLRRAYRKFYFRPGYVWKHIKRIKNLHDIKEYYQALRFIVGIGMKV